MLHLRRSRHPAKTLQGRHGERVRLRNVLSEAHSYRGDSIGFARSCPCAALMLLSHLRVARPARNLHRTTAMYCDGLGLDVVASFERHDGFDGVVLGRAGSDYQLEFTHSREHPIVPAPTVEDLIVFYIPGEASWRQTCASMLAAGFREVSAFNPYWAVRGRTYQDFDGYRVVLERAAWSSIARA